MIVYAGLPALSAFRLVRLNARLRERGAVYSVEAAQWLYFVEPEPGSRLDETALCRIVQAQASTPDTATGLVAVPRLGTISPWSSKATEILRGCGMAVQRIERGMRYVLSGVAPSADATEHAALRELYDPMTQSLLEDQAQAHALFEAGAPRALRHIALGGDAPAALRAANRDLGLALSSEEIEYLARRYGELRRDPTDAELMMFAQANSEHCRHKVFNAQWRIDGAAREHSLFGMIKHTHTSTPQHTLSAYKDNAAVVAGDVGARMMVDSDCGRWRTQREQIDYAIKVETHNHPTAISPFPGASTGSGGEIRDEGATGRGAKPKAGLTGFTVSHLRIPGLPRPWEAPRALPPRLASAFEIMRDGPLGGAAFNNEFGRPALLGYFRSFELPDADVGLTHGYDKPIMLAGGLANIRREHVQKKRLVPGDAIVVLGGPAMLIGLGGGAASSVGGGDSSAELDFASVQRDNPEMQRRCQEVIDACWALGEHSPIVSIHDVGAGGLSNAVPEILHDSEVGGEIELRDIPCADPQLSPMQVWCNESQERYVLGIARAHLAAFERVCARERCPYAVIGYATAEQHLRVRDRLNGGLPLDLPLDVLFGSTPRMLRDTVHRARTLAPWRGEGVRLDELLLRVLRHPSVGSKSFLVTIGDRSVGGLCARDQMVGPWQLPVADCAAMLNDFDGYAGQAMAMGERTPLALIDAAASARMAVGEALTNLLAAPVAAFDQIKLSANWMAAVAQPGEDAALFDAVRAVGLALCPALGLAIPVGKDSLSMQATWQNAQGVQRVVSPVSLIVSAFARVADVRDTLTPLLRTDVGPSSVLLVDLGAGRARLGGSIAAQVFGALGADAPDVDEPARLVAFAAALRAARARGLVLAYHDRSDGGALVAALEMAFAGQAGLEIALGAWGTDTLAALFNEELGVLLQVRDAELPTLRALLAEHGLGAHTHTFARVTTDADIALKEASGATHRWSRADLLAAWHETSHAMQRLRDNPDSADSERAVVCAAKAPGLAPKLSFDPAIDTAAPYIARGARPQIAVLREQGVNGQIEMAAAFMRAGFDAHDVHMTDLIEGRVHLASFHGLAACGGFSYGDVLGAGRGWATSIRFRAAVAEQFAAFFANPGTFTLGVCNGCQMLAVLKDLIPGAQHWPSFERNRSEQYEARLVAVEILDSPSILFRDMAGSRIPVVVAHGEGRAAYATAQDAGAALPCMRYVEADGSPTERFPLNPNGSPGGRTGFTSMDGRATILMPHPERVFRSVQMSWRPAEWGEDSPWMRMFRNARVWLG
jgi:phosphoribosylformylglycinamidine synthase